MASVFISYSHLDEAWKDRLDRHFRVFKLQGLAVEAWHDRRIPGGGDWEAEIQKAMAEADAAILMIVKDLRNPRDIAVAQRLDVSGDLVRRKRHVLEQSYGSLPVEGSLLLSRIACLRGAVDYKALCAASGGLAENEVEGQLQDLVERGLLHRDERAGRFDLHPIVRRYAYDRLGKEEKEETHRSLRDYFAAVPPVEKVKVLADLAPVIELYHHMVRAGEYDEPRELFRDRLNDAMYYQLGAYESCIELQRALFPDGEDRPPRLREERDQSWTLNTLANSYSLSGQPRRAVPLIERQIEIRERLGDKENLAIGLGNLAVQQVVIKPSIRRKTVRAPSPPRAAPWSWRTKRRENNIHMSASTSAPTGCSARLGARVETWSKPSGIWPRRWSAAGESTRSMPRLTS